MSNHDPMNSDEASNVDRPTNPAEPIGAEMESTTMRLPAVGGERIEGGHEGAYVLSRQDQAMVDALRPGTALLVVLRGPNTGARFLLDDVTVSRKHVVFSRVEGGFSVKDVGSLNGTYVNRNLIDEVRLATGDEVQIGKFRLVYYAARG
jgi:hypothetical protein